MPYSTREITPQLVKMNKKKGIVTLENHNTLAYIECKFKVRTGQLSSTS